MNSDQRRLAVVAVGAVCWAGANALNRWLIFGRSDGAWFNYAPTNGVALSPSGWQLRELVVWLVAIAIWYRISSRLLWQSQDE